MLNQTRFPGFAAVLLSAAVLLCSACGIAGTSAERAAEAARVERLVQERLDARSFRVDIDRMLPMRGGGRALTSPYSVTVDGTKLISNLPYFGVAHNVPYGGGKVLTFESEIASYREEAGEQDSRKIVLSTDNGEDVLTYTLLVFTNGKVSLDVVSRNREPISFQGTLDADADPKKTDQ
ncbi:MAG: DUF4251 domain-containing protein [Bacteroidales bacterium]|nr:DUF4251 domain-containing protein [Bacteroidales bacterium]